MNFIDWYKKRGARFILKRAEKLTERYNFDSRKAISRIRYCVEKLSAYRCQPTFFVPAIVFKRNKKFIYELQDKGCEIGVHGFQHIDMRSIPPQDANHHLQRAAELFRREGFQIDGFRCPYLSISDEILKELEPGLFNYSSNRAIAWMEPDLPDRNKNLFFDTIGGFYNPVLSQSSLSLPYRQENILEIPVSVPDDIQMRDGMAYNPDEISASFINTFKQIHHRGEFFNLMFHPELASLLIEPFLEVLGEVDSFKEKVWIARLRDISDWWKEKGDYKMLIERSNGEYHLDIDRPQRATLLQKGLGGYPACSKWDGKYYKLEGKSVHIKSNQLPLVSLTPGLPGWVGAALARKGYITLNVDDWQDCTVNVNNEFIGRCNNPVDLITSIEDLDVPLVRFWPWPDGYRSALCLSGDLDALSLLDYATRLLPMAWLDMGDIKSNQIL